MLHQEKTAQSVKPSSRVQRRKRQLIEPSEFVKIYGGSLRMKSVEGRYYCAFISEEIKAHAWGSSFSRAYRSMLRHFHEKSQYLTFRRQLMATVFAPKSLTTKTA